MRKTLLVTAFSLSLAGWSLPGLAQGLTPVDPAVQPSPSMTVPADQAPALMPAQEPPSDAAAEDAKEKAADATVAEHVPSVPAEDIAKVQAAGLMKGDTSGQFHAEGTLTRAELATILVKAFNLEKLPVTKPDFAMKDVPPTFWANRDIQTAMSRGVMVGYKDGYFYPNQPVTRAEALAIFGQAYGVQQIPAPVVNRILDGYQDSAQIPAWAKKSIATSLKNGFVDVVPMGQIRPMQPMTRGDMAYSLSRYLDRLTQPERKML